MYSNNSMKKNRRLIILVILLGSATTFMFMRNRNSTIREELKDFAVKDTAAITKVFLADRNNHEITLERKDGQWMVNGKFRPKRDVILNLLDVLYKVDVRTKVAKAAYNNVIKGLATTSVKCEVYLNGEELPVKTIYVGGQTEDALGTFMMLEKSSVPFITYIPGFNGYLSPRFTTNIDDWRENTLFHYTPDEISSVGIDYSNFPEKSFLLKVVGGKPSVTSTDGKRNIQFVDTIAVINYLDLFRQVYFESLNKDLKANQIDSMLVLPSAIVITVTDTKQAKQVLKLYPMPINKRSLALSDSLGKDLKFDVDRMYGYREPEKENVIIQHYSFDPIMRQYSDFDLNKPKKAGR